MNGNVTLSQRVQRVKPSPILQLMARVGRLKAEGKNIIELGIGEPDFDTPTYIKNAAKEAIDQGFTKYTAVEGILELRKAIAQKFYQDNGLSYETNQILVSNGGKQSFYNMAQSLLEKNEDVIIPAPYWTSYPDMVRLADANPVIVFAGIEQAFKITPEQLEKAITDKTRLVVFNSPSNPSGFAYSRAEWAKLADVLKKYPNIFIASDDMYEKIYWKNEPFSNILMVCPELADRIILLHGVSKTYAMTGWRIGFAAGPKPLIEAMSTLQSQSTSNACSISQKAALAALTGDQSCIQDMVQAYKERHDYVVQALNQIPGIECLPNDGTFYAFAKVQGLLEKMGFENEMLLADYFLQNALVALVPGTVFGAPGYLRLSYATSLENLHEAIKRITNCLKG